KKKVKPLDLLGSSGPNRGFVDGRPSQPRKTKGEPIADEPEYRVRGHLEVAGKISVSLSLGASIDILGFWNPSLGVGTTGYPIAQGGIAVDFDHVIGVDERPK